MWTEFYDLSSGGSDKTDWCTIYIEAPEDKARIIFENKFGRDPDNVTCNCCGRDYAIIEVESKIVDLEKLSGRVLVISKDQINP